LLDDLLSSSIRSSSSCLGRRCRCFLAFGTCRITKFPTRSGWRIDGGYQLVVADRSARHVVAVVAVLVGSVACFVG
jgi:hypothetical protein